jgi:hypothetical protein
MSGFTSPTQSGVAEFGLPGRARQAGDVGGLMHAMEIAHAEMRDAALEPAAVVGHAATLGGNCDSRAGVERALRPQSVRPLR